MTTPLTYPVDNFDQGKTLLEQLGSFWVNIFEDADRLQALTAADAQIWAQSHLNLLEAAAAVSRFTIPVFHTENWFLWTVRLSDKTSQASRCGIDQGIYGAADGFEQTYGGENNTPTTELPAPPGLCDAAFTIQNMVVYPSRIWVNGVDYLYDEVRNVLRFRDNPFLDPLIPKRDIVNNLGQKVDEEIAMWIYKGSFDLEYVYKQFGYVLGLKLKSSDGYKQLLNSLWDMYLEGMTIEHLNLFLSALSGAPLSLDSEETVEVIRREVDSTVIVTTSRVYRASNSAGILVSVGDTIYAGTPLTDAISVTELSSHNPDYSKLPYLSLSNNLLGGSYRGDLVFKNHDVELEYLGRDADNRAMVKFETSGFPGDVALFWDFVHSTGKNPNGPTGGKTLANLLDVRTNKVGEPIKQSLPSLINPLQFVVENLLRNNLFVISIKLGSFLKGAPGDLMLTHLRDVIPANTTFIAMVTLPDLSDSVDLTFEGSYDEAGVSESTAYTDGLTKTESVAYNGGDPGGEIASYKDGEVVVKLISINCAG